MNMKHCLDKWETKKKINTLPSMRNFINLHMWRYISVLLSSYYKILL